jgi:hypothetical protein
MKKCLSAFIVDQNESNPAARSPRLKMWRGYTFDIQYIIDDISTVALEVGLVVNQDNNQVQTAEISENVDGGYFRINLGFILENNANFTSATKLAVFPFPASQYLPVFVDVIDPCGSSGVYLRWDNSLGGRDSWYFEGYQFGDVNVMVRNIQQVPNTFDNFLVNSYRGYESDVFQIEGEQTLTLSTKCDYRDLLGLSELVYSSHIERHQVASNGTKYVDYWTVVDSNSRYLDTSRKTVEFTVKLKNLAKRKTI